VLAYLNFEGRPPTDNDRSHMCLLVAVSGLRLRGMSVDILAQIGVVVLVTLTSEKRLPDRRICQAGTRCGGFYPRCRR
jgi:hypothetical protein